MKMARRISLLLMLFVLVTSACAPRDGQPGEDGDASAISDTVVAALAEEPVNLDPQSNGLTTSRAVQKQIFNSLLDYGKNGELVPELATSWEQIDDLTVRFHLREGVYFHNGEEFTAEDVKFTMQRAAVTGPNKAMFEAYEDFDIIDPHTIDFKLKYKFAPMFNYLASPYAAIHSKKHVEEVGDDRLLREPVGTGPFKFKEWKAGDRIILERNDEFWGEKAAYKRLDFRFITESAARIVELETGGVDIIYNVQPHDVARLEANKDVKVVSGMGRRYTYITLNMKDPIFSDPGVRYALACALDLDAIIDTVYTGMATVADSIVSPQIFGYKSMGIVPYDPDKARELLKEAGYGDGLHLVLKANDNPLFIQIAEIAQNMWKQVGVTVDTVILEMATYQDQGAAGEVQLGISSYSTSGGDPDQTLYLWRSEGYKGQLQGNDPKIDEMLLVARQEMDPELRKQRYAEAIEYMWNTHHHIPVAFNDVIYATRANIDGLVADIAENPVLANIVKRAD